MNRKRAILIDRKPLSGNNVSHAHNKTRRKQRLNLQYKSIYVPELDRSLRLRLSTRTLRTITKMGLLPFLKKRGLQLKDLL